MFKKTLLALALTGLAGTATAGTVSAGANNTANKLKNGTMAVSVEGAVGTSSYTLNDVTFTINDSKKADYASLKTVTVDIAGATLSPATSASLALVSTGDTFNTANVVVSYPTSTQVKFDVLGTAPAFADGGAAGLAAGAKFTISGLDLVFASKDAGSQVSYTVTAKSSVGGAEIDKGSAAVAQFVTQFSAKVDPKLGSNKVDVAQGRKLFAASQALPTGKTDTTTVVIEQAPIDLLAANVVAGTYNFTLNGDFSFLDVDGNDKVDQEFTLSGVAAKDLQSTAVTKATAATAKFDFATDGSVVLPVQTFFADASVQYKTVGAGPGATAATFEAKGLYAGAWSLNGTSKDITFMPFGSAYAQSITVTNRGTVVGEIEVVLTYNGKNYTKTLTAVAAAKSVTDISKEVAAFAKASGITGNANVKVIVNSPSVDVDAVYYSKKDADRVKTF